MEMGIRVQRNADQSVDNDDAIIAFDENRVCEAEADCNGHSRRDCQQLPLELAAMRFELLGRVNAELALHLRQGIEQFIVVDVPVAMSAAALHAGTADK